MDHKLAIVIVPAGSKDPILTSRLLLESHQKIPRDDSEECFRPKFRYKRVGGWFDGLARGWIGEEQWSTVLRLLLSGAETSEAFPLRGFGPETIRKIESRIESENTLQVAEFWSAAPCSIVVTPSGEWFSGPLSDEPNPSEGPHAFDLTDPENWQATKLALFEQYRESLAVAWDLSWHFIGPPPLQQARRPRMPRAWGSRGAQGINRRSWPEDAGSQHSTGVASAARLAQELIDDAAALERWAGEGGAPSAPARPVAAG